MAEYSTAFRQRHFILWEIILPYNTVCTPVEGLIDSFHTPKTCKEPSDAEYRLWLCQDNAPLNIIQPQPSINQKSILNSQISRVVNSASEKYPTLNGGQGIASFGSMSIKCTDFKGDPGPITFTEDGTFFGKLIARNVLEGKKIVTHKYTIETVNNAEVPKKVSESIHIISETNLTNGQFSLSARDPLSLADNKSQSFPIPSEIYLSSDIDENTRVIPVNSTDGIVANRTIRIDDELMYVDSVGDKVINVLARGTSIINPDGITVYKTNRSTHNADSTVQLSYTMSKSEIWDVLLSILTDIGLAEYCDYESWKEELSEWNSDSQMYGVFSKPERGQSLLRYILSAYLIDMWFDQNTQKIKVSAVSAWKQSIRVISEGNDLAKLKIKSDDSKRYTRALMYNKKEFKAKDDDITNYSKHTIASDAKSETSDFYGSVKLYEFKNNDFITPQSAQTSVSRFVQRWSRAPRTLTFEMEERKLAGIELGDIVDVISRDSQTPSGKFLQARDRCQVINIKPNYNDIGRRYNITALSYVPFIASGEDLTIELSGDLYDIDLFSRAGAPNIAIDVTFILKNATIGSTDHRIPSISAGAFKEGSRIKIICQNVKWSAIGGKNYDVFYSTPSYLELPYGYLVGDKYNGGDSYDSNGIETEIYLNYGEVDGFNTSCLMLASGGAGEVGKVTTAGFINSIYLGGGGSGIAPGKGGEINGYGSYHPTPSNDGSFTSGGNGSIDPAGNFIAKGGKGGYSTDGGAIVNDPRIPDFRMMSSATLAGGAIKGSGVTVYNLSSVPGSFRPGRSDPFTLIDS